jgi:two-component system chemotaxis response regulator CheB
METQPTPIVVVTESSGCGEVEKSLMATEAGALAVLQKPAGISHPRFPEMSQHLLETVKLMSEVKVVRRRPSRRRGMPSDSTVHRPEQRHDVRVVAIGTSTGGPLALKTIFSQLPTGYALPILVVQHIARGFAPGFVDWLNGSSAVRVTVAAHGQRLVPGNSYVAPDGLQMTVDMHHQIVLRDDPTENGHKPSISTLFRSVADVYGDSTVGVLLTGMGKDGAQELKRLKATGAITIAQKPDTCVVDSMPAEAIRIGAARHKLAPDEIGAYLSRLGAAKD